MKELSNLIRYNSLRACKVKTHGASAIRPMEDACRGEGEKGSNAEDEKAQKAIL